MSLTNTSHYRRYILGVIAASVFTLGGCPGGGGGGSAQTTVSVNVVLGIGSPGTPVTPFCAEVTGSGPGTPLDSGKVLEQGLISDPNGNIAVNFFGGIKIVPAGSWQWTYLEGQASMSNGVYSCPASTPMNNFGGCGRQVIAHQANLITMTKTVNGMVCQ